MEHKQRQIETCNLENITKRLQSFLNNNGQHVPNVIRPNGLKFFMPSNEHIVQKSVFEIKEAKDILSNRLGVSDWSSSCETCDAQLEHCQGHFGHLTLTLPCFRFSFTKQLENILNCICFYCQNLRIPKHSAQYNWLKNIEPKYRMFFILEICKKYKRCGNLDQAIPVEEYLQSVDSQGRHPNCGHELVNFKCSPDMMYINAIVNLTMDDYNAYKRDNSWQPTKIYLTDIYKCIQCIDNETVEMLGLSEYNHPRSHMWRYIPIPSLNVRPQHTYNGLGKDKMLKYNAVNILIRHIVNANVKMNKMLNKLESKQRDFLQLPLIDLTVYNFGMQSSQKYIITSNIWKECFQLAGCNESERKRHNARIKKNRKTNDNKEHSDIFSAWYQLNLKIASFQFTKAQKFARQDWKNCVSHNMESRYSKSSAKHTRFRGELCGQRLNMSARSVAEGASSYIYPNQVYLPTVVCMGLTVNMLVTRENASQVKRLIDRGANRYPGANYVQLKSGEMIDLSCARQRFDIDIDQVLYISRHLVEGDIVLLTRSPALHKLSIIALYVKVMHEKVFRVHYTVFKGLALDLDGDEIAIFVPQTDIAIYEAKTCMLPSQNIMKDGAVWMNFIFNSIVGAYLMTRDNVEFDIDFHVFPFDLYTTDVQNRNSTHLQTNYDLACRRTRSNYDLTCRRFRSNYDYISYILPSDFYFSHNGVFIVNGRYKRGVLTSKVLNGPKGIIATLCRVYGGNVAMDFIYQGYQLFQAYSDIFGHTISIDHVTFDSQTTRQRHQQVKDLQKRVHSYITTLPTRFTSQRERLEDHINAYIGYICKFVAEDTYKRLISRQNAKHNGLVLMIESGSKGSQTLASQMISLIGQVYVNFQRYKKAFLAYFNDQVDGEHHLEKFGFNNRSYFLGSDVKQFICASYSTIESCLLKVKGTALSGTMLRNTALVAQSTTINSNGQVVDNGRTILQETYGDDNYDSTMLM